MLDDAIVVQVNVRWPHQRGHHVMSVVMVSSSMVVDDHHTCEVHSVRHHCYQMVTVVVNYVVVALVVSSVRVVNHQIDRYQCLHQMR